MSAKFNQVKYWYMMGQWDITKVRNAVAKSWITPEEFEQITGEEYE